MEKLNLNPSSHIEPAPEPTAVDHALTVGKLAAIAFSPFASGMALVELLTAPLRGKRMNDWSEKLRLGLNDLSQQLEDLTPERLVKNEALISAFAQATQAALKTDQAEKLEALRNAVLNVAAGRDPGDDLQSIFLNLVDGFTPIHLQVLAHFVSRDPEMIVRFREGQPELAGLAMRDLLDRNLLRDARPYAARNRDLPPGSLIAQSIEITDLGKRFLAFVAAPV